MKVTKYYCDKCEKELTKTEERWIVYLGKQDNEGSKLFNISEDTLCRKCAQGYKVDINGMEGVGE